MLHQCQQCGWEMSGLKLRAQGFDIIGVVETWATADINDAELAIEGYNNVSSSARKRGGLINHVHQR